MPAMQVPRLRAKTAALLFREQFETLVKDTKSALDVIATAVQQVGANQWPVCTRQVAKHNQRARECQRMAVCVYL